MFVTDKFVTTVFVPPPVAAAARDGMGPVAGRSGRQDVRIGLPPGPAARRPGYRADRP